MRGNLCNLSGDPAVVDGVVADNLHGGIVRRIILNAPVIRDVVHVAVGGVALMVPFAGAVRSGVTHTEVDLQVCGKMVVNKHM